MQEGEQWDKGPRETDSELQAPLRTTVLSHLSKVSQS